MPEKVCCWLSWYWCKWCLCENLLLQSVNTHTPVHPMTPLSTNGMGINAWLDYVVFIH